MLLTPNPNQTQRLIELLDKARDLHEQIDDVLEDVAALLEVGEDDAEYDVLSSAVHRSWSPKKLLRKLIGSEPSPDED